jgi:hypothetical protein
VAFGRAPRRNPPRHGRLHRLFDTDSRADLDRPVERIAFAIARDR